MAAAFFHDIASFGQDFVYLIVVTDSLHSVNAKAYKKSFIVVFLLSRSTYQYFF